MKKGRALVQTTNKNHQAFFAYGFMQPCAWETVPLMQFSPGKLATASKSYNRVTGSGGKACLLHFPIALCNYYFYSHLGYWCGVATYSVKLQKHSW